MGRWNVASLYVLYCPTLSIFVSCCSFIQIDAPWWMLLVAFSGNWSVDW